MMFEIVGAPFDLCGMQVGSRLGPAALRLAGLAEVMAQYVDRVVDLGDIESSCPQTSPGGLRNFPALIETAARVKASVGEILGRGVRPLMIGGEHTLSAGSVAAAVNHFGTDLAVLWIDAHADINTPGSSDTGNIHGMPVAALLGHSSGCEGVRDDEWKEFLAILGPARLDEHAIAWYALRDVDRHERPLVMKGLPITMHNIDRKGIEATVAAFDKWMTESGRSKLWVSFDVDALDPILAPGTGTAVRGGLTYREAHLMAELLWECMSCEKCTYTLAGLDLVETNPLTDSQNTTAKMAVEWVASLLGKTVLGVNN